MTGIMRRWGVEVTAVEIDPSAEPILRQSAQQVIIGDLDDPRTLEPLGDSRFDVVLASDVLEHLKDPLRCLRQATQFVAPGGRVILSIPNFAHADIRLSLLAGNFEYADMGLLDRTHIKFFTRRSLENLIAAAGLIPIKWHRTERAIGETEIPVPPELVDWGRQALANDPEADTYQWLVECKLRDAQSPLAATPAKDVDNSVVAFLTRGFFARAKDRFQRNRPRPRGV
jgi:SAM-dependent methyltransferase